MASGSIPVTAAGVGKKIDDTSSVDDRDRGFRGKTKLRQFNRNQPAGGGMPAGDAAAQATLEASQAITDREVTEKTKESQRKLKTETKDKVKGKEAFQKEIEQRFKEFKD